MLFFFFSPLNFYAVTAAKAKKIGLKKKVHLRERGLCGYSHLEHQKSASFTC